MPWRTAPRAHAPATATARHSLFGIVRVFGDVERELCSALRPLLGVVPRAAPLPQGAVHPPVPRHGGVEGIDAASDLAVGEEGGAVLHLGGSVVAGRWRGERPALANHSELETSMVLRGLALPAAAAAQHASSSGGASAAWARMSGPADR